MKTLLILAVVFIALYAAKRALAGDLLAPAEAAARVSAGKAILIDVREPDEWSGGVVTGAHLLPLSDLRGERKLWGPILEANRDKELILYCRSGNRSGIAVRALNDEKFTASNAGGFSTWKAAGQPVRVP